jgi:aspartyl protease family protein
MIQSFLKNATLVGVANLLLFSIPFPDLAAEQVEVSYELERLAEEYGFAVLGLEKTEESFGRAEGEELYLRLRRLLENFDHVIVQSPTGAVDRVIVLGVKVPFVPSPPTSVPDDEDTDIRMETQRHGSQHLVRVSLDGKGATKIQRELQVDTGSDYLVLPVSLIEALGVDKESLKAKEMQTANGKVQAQVGTLPSLWLGNHRIRNVETAFLDDEKLAGNGLLGMSVLGRYKLTIDEEGNSITLGRKEGGDGEKGAKALLRGSGN